MGMWEKKYKHVCWGIEFNLLFICLYWPVAGEDITFALWAFRDEHPIQFPTISNLSSSVPYYHSPQLWQIHGLDVKHIHL